MIMRRDDEVVDDSDYPHRVVPELRLHELADVGRDCHSTDGDCRLGRKAAARHRTPWWASVSQCPLVRGRWYWRVGRAHGTL